MHGNQLQQDKNVVAQHLLDGRRLQVGDFFWEFVGFGHRATVSGGWGVHIALVLDVLPKRHPVVSVYSFGIDKMTQSSSGVFILAARRKTTASRHSGSFQSKDVDAVPWPRKT